MAELRQTVNAPDAPRAVGPYSHAVRAGVDGDVAAQTTRVFANLLAVLTTAGLTFAHVVKVNVYLTDLSDFAAMNEVYAQTFSEPYPARTTVAVAGLPLEAHVEIELIAQA